jgi:hypothetical protein
VVNEVDAIGPDMMNRDQAAVLAKCSRDVVGRAADNDRLPWYSRKNLRNGQERRSARLMKWFKKGDVKAWVDAGRPTSKVKPAPAPIVVDQANGHQLPLLPTADQAQLQDVLKQLADLKLALAPLQQLADDVAFLKKALAE